MAIRGTHASNELKCYGSESTKSVPFQNQTIFHFWGNSEATRKVEIPGWLEIPSYDSPRRPPKRACPPTGPLQRETSAGSPAEPGKMGLQWRKTWIFGPPKWELTQQNRSSSEFEPTEMGTNYEKIGTKRDARRGWNYLHD